jgi:acyl-homoserine lactone acylase PvdQ
MLISVRGYVVARDRLFQIDLQLRRDLGRLAEAFGARFVPHDHAARLLLYRGDVESELAGLPRTLSLAPAPMSTGSTPASPSWRAILSIAAGI